MRIPKTLSCRPLRGGMFLLGAPAPEQDIQMGCRNYSPLALQRKKKGTCASHAYLSKKPM